MRALIAVMHVIDHADERMAARHRPNLWGMSKTWDERVASVYAEAESDPYARRLYDDG